MSKPGLVGLRGGPLAGVREVWTGEVTPQLLESIFQGYWLKWIKRDPDIAIEDPLGVYKWIARMEWKGA